MSTRVQPAARRDRERELWRLLPQLLRHPRRVFEALREDSDELTSALQEPVLAIAGLSGICAVLVFSGFHQILDHTELPNVDGLTFAAWAIIGGGAAGFVSYWLVGVMVYLGLRAQGSLDRARRARHVLAIAAVPVALATLIVWPVRLAIYGTDLFRAGGSDTGAPNVAFDVVLALFAVWAVGLLVLGVEVAYSWSRPRAAGAVGLAMVFLVLFGAIPVVLH